MKLHLGCGSRYIPGFIHVDLCGGDHIDYRHDVRTLPMFRDGTAELIYASHVLEYFDCEEVWDVLTEWRRVLKPGGTLRIAVPDMAALMCLYHLTGDMSRLVGPMYGRMKVRGVWIYHKMAYDYETLRKTLEDSSFKDVRRYDWRKTIHRHHDDFSKAYYPHMDTSGLLISLNVEATK